MTQRMIGPAVRRGTKGGFEEARDTSHVMDKDHPMYRGRFGPQSPLHKTPEAGRKLKDEWDVANTRRNANRAIQEGNEKLDRMAGKQYLIAGGGFVGASGALGLGGRAAINADNRKMERKLGVRKAWSREDPLMWHAEKENGAHKVTVLGENGPKVKTTRLARIGRAMQGSKGEAATAGVGLLATGAMLGPMLGPSKRNEELQDKLARRRRVAKGEKVVPTPEQIAASKARRAAQLAEAAAAKEKVANTPKGGIWTGKPISQTWRNHVSRGQVRNAVTSGLLAGAVATPVLVSQRQRKVEKADDTRRRLEMAGGAVAGAATMDTLNTVGGQTTKAVLKERRNRRGFSPNEEKNWADHKKRVLGTKAGQPVPNDDSVPQAKKAELYRTAPKNSIPDRTANRLLAFKNTKGWTTGSLAGAAGVGALAAQRRGRVEKSIDDMPRAAARAAKKNKPRKTPEEIEQLRREAAERAKTRPPKPQQQAAPPPPPTPPVRPRSSFLGRGQVRDLAIGVPLGTAALAYGMSPRQKDERVRVGKKDKSKDRWSTAAGVSGLTAVGAHSVEGRQLRLSERELSRVISANNADGVGQGDFHPDQPRIDRGKHARRAVNHMDNVRLARGTKIMAGLGALGAGYKTVEKRDRNDNARVAAGAVGGAALLDATDTVVGASLKRGAVVARDWDRKKAKATKSPEDFESHVKAQNTILREHGAKHGLVDDRGRGRAPKPSDAHKTKNAYYRSYPTAIPGGRLQRLNSLRDKKTGTVLAAGGLLGGGLTLNRQRVEKRNNFAMAGGATGFGGVGAYLQARRSGNREEAKEVLGATAGGWAAQGAYQGAGYGYRNAVRGINGSKVPRHELPHLKPTEENFPDPEQRKLRAQNAKEREQLNRHHPRKADQKRNTPKNWHGSRMERLLGRTHAGKTGAALSAGLTGAGVYAGAELASSKKRPLQRESVRKGDRQYGYMERKRNKARTAGAGVGIGTAAWGASRLKLGPGVGFGLRAAEKHGSSGTKTVIRGARSARDGVRHVTGQAEGVMRGRIPGFGTSLDKIPADLRPKLAVGAGGLLAARSIPTHDERFVPYRGW